MYSSCIAHQQGCLSLSSVLACQDFYCSVRFAALACGCRTVDGAVIAAQRCLFCPELWMNAIGQAGQDQAGELARHLNETEVAVRNRFIPIFMVPEAAQYRNEQKHLQLQRHQRRKHAPDVIRAAAPMPDHVQQRELLSTNAQNTTVQKAVPAKPAPAPQTDSSTFMMVMYGLRNLVLNIWYWLPTSEEVLLWLSEYVPVADVLIMDYYRLRLGSMPSQKVAWEVPVDPLDQALHDAWVHR